MAPQSSRFLTALKRLRNAWSASERRTFRDSLAAHEDGFYRATLDGELLYANDALVRLAGLENTGPGFDLVEQLASARRAVQPDFLENLVATDSVCGLVYRLRRHDDRIIWVSETARLVRDPATGRPLCCEGFLRDVSEQRRHSAFEQRLDKLATNLPGGLFQLVRDRNGSFSVPYLSLGFVRLLGLESDRPVEDPDRYLNRIHGEDLPHYLQRMRDSADSMTQWNCEFRYFPDPNSSRMIWLHLIATPEATDDAGIIWHGHLTDITARKQTEERVRHLADYDPLTGLPNRRVFMRELQAAMEKCAATGEHATVLFIDLDNFKTLNDTFGHEVGDRLLCQVADRLNDCIRATDAVSRFGGDEFVLLITGLGYDHEAAQAGASGAANRVLREFAAGFDLGQVEHATSPSIGAVVFDGKGDSASHIIKCADIAMYDAKKSGRNQVVLFDAAKLREVSASYALQSQLHAAASRNELFFEFQPQIDTLGKIVGCEALVRWAHPVHGRLAPAEFIPMAETTGTIREINNWVIREAFQTLARWRDRPHMKDLSLAINISFQHLQSESFVPDMLKRLGNSGVNGSLLTLELTENLGARHTASVAGRMQEMRNAGIRFSLDDFGTGYSSLSQLNRLPFDEVKIDGTFVARLETEHSNRSLIEAILGMAAALQLDTVAEHVGSPFQESFLKQRGCKRFQGYYYHPPLSEAELDATVKQRSGQPPLLAVVS